MFPLFGRCETIRLRRAILDKRERLSDLAGQIAGARGLELVEVELFQAGHREVLRVYLDRPGGITVNECAEVSRELSALLDAEELFQQTYVLEISSPGLDRPLRTPRDWERRIGEWVRVHLNEPVEGKVTWIGKLKSAGVDSALIVSEPGGLEITIPYRTVQLARVDVRFED